MAQLYLFNPTHKLRLLSKLLFRGSKRLLRNANAPRPLPTIYRDNVNLSYALPPDSGASVLSNESLVHDPDFYLRDSDGCFCVFQVESTLFKVHRCLLLREPSAFTDMFSLPNIYSEEGKNDSSPIVLSDTVGQFRDLLWILYAPPSVFLSDPPTPSPMSFKRLLNIVEMTNKYCFESYASWAIERLSSVVRDPTGPLCKASPELLARVLHLAALCDHKTLLDVVTQHIISRLLWYNMRPDAILEVAERHRLAKIIGVIYYKQLIEMEQASYDDRSSTQPMFPYNICVEKRMQLLAAHHSLVKLWERLRVTPPSFHHEECADAEECGEIWTQLWANAGNTHQTLRHGSADVLGRLKAVMINLRKTFAGTTTMSVPCTLAALESISQARDDIIDGLIDHFVEL